MIILAVFVFIFAICMIAFGGHSYRHCMNHDLNNNVLLWLSLTSFSIGYFWVLMVPGYLYFVEVISPNIFKIWIFTYWGIPMLWATYDLMASLANCKDPCSWNG